MKDLTLKKEEQKDFILDIVEDDASLGTLKVLYADGGYNKAVQNTSKNIQLAEEKMEEQATTAVANLKKYKSKVKTDTAKMVLSGAVPAGAGYILHSNIETLQDNPTVLFTTLGIVAVLGMGKYCLERIKDKKKLKEVEKIKYRDDNREILETFADHYNSLNELNDKTVRNLTITENPFGIRNLDNLSQETLETIIANIEREEKIPFTYAKTVKAR